MRRTWNGPRRVRGWPALNPYRGATAAVKLSGRATHAAPPLTAGRIETSLPSAASGSRMGAASGFVQVLPKSSLA